MFSSVRVNPCILFCVLCFVSVSSQEVCCVLILRRLLLLHGTWSAPCHRYITSCCQHSQPTAQGQTMISHYWHQRTSHLKCLLNRIDYLFADFSHYSCQKGQPGSVICSVIQCSLDRTEPCKAFASNSRKCHKCYICEVSHPIANWVFLFNSEQKILLQ